MNDFWKQWSATLWRYANSLQANHLAQLLLKELVKSFHLLLINLVQVTSWSSGHWDRFVSSYLSFQAVLWFPQNTQDNPYSLLDRVNHTAKSHWPYPFPHDSALESSIRIFTLPRTFFPIWSSLPTCHHHSWPDSPSSLRLQPEWLPQEDLTLVYFHRLFKEPTSVKCPCGVLDYTFLPTGQISQWGGCVCLPPD